MEHDDVKIEHYEEKMEHYDVKMEHYDVKMEPYEVKMEQYDVKMEIVPHPEIEKNVTTVEQLQNTKIDMEDFSSCKSIPKQKQSHGEIYTIHAIYALNFQVLNQAFGSTRNLNITALCIHVISASFLPQICLI